MPDAVKGRIDGVRDLAAEAFARHRLSARYSQGEYRSWRCKGPGGWAYGFDVTLEPGRVLVCGDIGLLALNVYGDPLPWLRGSMGDPWYLAGKAAPEIETDEWDPELAREWLDAQLAEGEGGRVTAGRASELRGVLEHGGGEHQFGDAFVRLTRSTDLPDCRNLKYGFLWQREALGLFLRLLDQGEEGDTCTSESSGPAAPDATAATAATP